MNARKIVERPHRVNLSNLNAKPLRFLMADKSVSLSQSALAILWETRQERRRKGKEGRKEERKRDFFRCIDDK